jgi:hypothetical protein
MWRALFLAIGIYLMILGAECMVIDKAVMAAPPPGELGLTQPTGPRDVVPPEWAPWSLMSAGAVVVLYSFTIPKRVAG